MNNEPPAFQNDDDELSDDELLRLLSQINEENFPIAAPSPQTIEEEELPSRGQEPEKDSPGEIPAAQTDALAGLRFYAAELDQEEELEDHPPNEPEEAEKESLI